jgi:acetoin utilization deacetylase AcuC-like enzyme/GNAT superfamily N-acetyltransferase
MFKIRRVYDDVLPVNRDILRQVQQIMRTQFPGLPEKEVEGIGERFRDPFKQRFGALLLSAENMRRRVLGFAMMLHDRAIGFCFLEWIATAAGTTAGGLGGALYDRVRNEAAVMGARALFFESLPDDPRDCPNPALLKQNRARLRFYERYGARPIINTAYEAPVKPDDTCMPYLVYDGLDRSEPLRRRFARAVVRAILERKYAGHCPPDYVEHVVSSFHDDPVRLRPLRYLKPGTVAPAVQTAPAESIALVVTDRHEIHHVHERGYVEAPVRIRSIMEMIRDSGLFEAIAPRKFGERHITAVHAADLVLYLRRACAQMPPGKSLYPYVFPLRNKTRPPKEPSVLSGYYCLDTFTPINHNAYPAARRSVDCALTAAEEILAGRRMAYALVRPPGHHAETRAFGGFCYFNNSAVAAHYLSAHGSVAILDIDYHHGNGQQEIFYRRGDILTISIHGHPRFAYPYFSGFEDERGEGPGEGCNLNMPLPEKIDGERYRRVLGRALRRITLFAPRFLVVALGLDPAKGDPTGTWLLGARDFQANGRMIAAVGLPTLVIQEGGYRNRTLGSNTLHFFRGLAAGKTLAATARKNHRKPVVEKRPPEIALRYEVHPEDPERIRELTTLTGFFKPFEVLVAVELVQERLAKGAQSGYHFILAQEAERLAGYACYGPIPCTDTSYDLYWIAVHPSSQRHGIGRRLMIEAERLIAQAGGQRVYVETSQRPDYGSTRRFYERCGYRVEAILPDFYSPGDDKLIYCKVLSQGAIPNGMA